MVHHEISLHGYTAKAYTNIHGQFCASLTKSTPKGRYKEKRVWAYAYKSLQAAIDVAIQAANSIEDVIKEKERKTAERKAKNALVNAADHYKVGDIIYNTWGWEQTNIDYYVVTSVSAKTITVQEIQSGLVNGEESFMSGRKAPIEPVQRIEDGDKFRLTVRPNGYIASPSDHKHYYFSKWDDQPLTCSWYG